MKITSITLALILASSSALQAQDVTYLSYGLGYTSQDFGGGTFETTSVDGTIEYSVNQYYFMADADATFFASGGGTDELTGLKLRAGYQFGPGSLVYLGIGNIDFGSSVNGYEVGGQYDFGAGQAGLLYVSLDGGTVESATLAVDYAVAPGTRVGIAHTAAVGSDLNSTILFGSYENGPLAIDASFDTFGGSGDLSLARIGATYEFGGQFRGLGSVVHADFIGNDITRVALGGGYNIAENMWIDATYANLSTGGGDTQSIGLMFTFETGDRALVVDRALTARSVPYNEIGSMFTLFGEAAEFGIINF